MKSDIYKLDQNDFVRSAISSVFVAVIVALAGVVGPTFDLFSADWIVIGKMIVNTAIATFVARLSEKFLSNADGKVLGRWG